MSPIEIPAKIQLVEKRETRTSQKNHGRKSKERLTAKCPSIRLLLPLYTFLTVGIHALNNSLQGCHCSAAARQRRPFQILTIFAAKKAPA